MLLSTCHMLGCMVGSTRTPKARALGAALRAAREERDWSQRKLAGEISRDSGLVSRWESGERAPRATDVARILAVLGVNGEQYDEIVAMASGTDEPRWLAVSLPAQRQQLAALLECERTASKITHVAPLLIPGVLQINQYIRAIITSTTVETAEVETRVMVRIGRRDVITREDPAELAVFLGEAALRQVIGSRAVMAAQLRYLVELSELPNVELRIVPYESGWHPGLEGMFMLIDSEHAPPVVHLENRKSGLFLHEDEDVATYRQAVDSVTRAAMSPEDSEGLIAKIANEMETTQ
jgi:transcriptional regulator with XRE-family HTH domain